MLAEHSWRPNSDYEHSEVVCGAFQLWRQKPITNLGCIALPQPPCSPDLAPSDFSLFGLIKDELCRQHFPSNPAIIAAVKQWVMDAGTDFCQGWHAVSYSLLVKMHI